VTWEEGVGLCEEGLGGGRGSEGRGGGLRRGVAEGYAPYMEFVGWSVLGARLGIEGN
jgi:hypothetical protein